MYDEIADFIGKRCVGAFHLSWCQHLCTVNLLTRAHIVLLVRAWLSLTSYTPSACAPCAHAIIFLQQCRPPVPTANCCAGCCFSVACWCWQWFSGWCFLWHVLQATLISPTNPCARARMSRIKIEQNYAKELQNLVKSQKPCTDSGCERSPCPSRLTLPAPCH
jgi:hypothetical protein